MNSKTLLNLIIFTLILFLSAAITAAQEAAKSKATPKPTTQTTPKPTPKTPKSEDPFMFEVDEMFKEITSQAYNVNQQKAEELYKQGLEHWKNFDINEAIDSYNKALAINPNYIDALRERGRIYAMIGKEKEAIPDLTAFLKTQPSSSEFLNLRGMAYAGITEKLLDYEADGKLIEENGNKAIADFNKAVELDPKSAVFFNNRGKLLLDFGMYQEAVNDLEEAVRLDNKFAVAYSNLGLAKSYLNSTSGLTELKRAIELDPKSAAVYYNRGKFKRKLYLFDEAIADFTKAIEFHGTKPKYYNARGMMYYATGDGAAAVRDFTTAVAQDAEFAGAYLNRALTYKKYPNSAADKKDDVWAGVAAQHQKMMSDLTLAIKHNPNLTEAYIERGWLNLTTTSSSIDGKLDAESLIEINTAFADFDKAVKLDPKSASARNGRASCYEKLGKKDLALADYSKAIELDPNLATAYMGRMGIYCEIGKKELSIADEKKVKELGFATINVCNLGK